MGLLAGTAAQSAVTEASSINTTYIYGFNGNLSGTINGGEAQHLRVDDVTDGFVSEFGLDINATLDNGNFDYLHNVYCVGDCRISAITEIVFKLTNDGSEATQVRFDSLITPGHLAGLGLDSTSVLDADFSLSVYRTSTADGAPFDPDATSLYSTQGVIAGFNTSGSMTGGALNGVLSSGDGSVYKVFDWSATNLNLMLDLAAGETTYVHYLSSINAQSNADCTDLSNCAGAQAVFGDPRNNGGVVENSTGLPGFGLFQAMADPLQPVIGRDFGTYQVTANLAAPGDPLPPTPPILPAVIYGAPFESQAVPEPASWAMLIAGFALVGGAMRRRSAPGGVRA